MKIYIDKEKEYQIFEGFGASGAWWAQEVGGWTHPDANSGLSVRDRISQLLFSQNEGIGLRIYRYNIGAGSKHSGNGHINNPLRRTENFEVSVGNYDFTRDKNAVYMMKQAVKDGASEVIFFVNSPIERLTKNGKSHCDKYAIFSENLPKRNYIPFADYCLDITEHFVSEGLPVKYLSPINEPLWRWTGGQEGCHYSPRNSGKVLKAFAEEMDKRDALAEIKLAGLENGDIRWFNKSYTKSLLNYDAVKKRVDSVDLHSYFLIPVSFPGINRAAYLKRYRRWMDKHYPDLKINMSEWTHMQEGRDKGMSSALVMAKVIYEDISILNVASWQHWIAVSEVDYCDGLIYINLADKTFEMTKRYYATGNFSKYIPYGARRVAAYGNDRDLKILAFVKNNRNVLIVINDSEKEKSISLPADTKGATLAVTNEKCDLEEFKLQSTNVKISAESVNTIIF